MPGLGVTARIGGRVRFYGPGGEVITVLLGKRRGNRVRLQIDADPKWAIYRQEIDPNLTPLQQRTYEDFGHEPD